MKCMHEFRGDEFAGVLFVRLSPCLIDVRPSCPNEWIKESDRTWAGLGGRRILQKVEKIGSERP